MTFDRFDLGRDSAYCDGLAPPKGFARTRSCLVEALVALDDSLSSEDDITAIAAFIESALELIKEKEQSI